MERIIYSLSDDNIEFIREDVRKCSLTLPNLEEELIDHICCMVEEKLAEGFSFDKAYQTVRKNVGIDSLKDIEIKAILLIEQKIQSMKTSLKITGIAGLSTVLLGSLFKVMHWPGSSILIFIGFLILSFGYIPFLMLTIKKENMLKRKAGLAYTGIIAAFAVLINILFTIMHWPYQEFLTYGSWIVILLFLVMLFKSIMKSEENRVLNLSVILFLTLLFILNITFYWINLKNPKITHYTLERNIKESTLLFEEKSGLLYNQFDTIQEIKIRSEIIALKTKTDSIVSQIKLLQGYLFRNEQEKDNYNRRIFKKKIDNNAEDEAIRFSEDITNYREFILDHVADSTNLRAIVDGSLQFGNHDFNNPPPVVYNNLEKLIRDIRIIESVLLSEKISD